MTDIPEYFVDNIQIASGPGGMTMVVGASQHPTIGAGIRVHCVLRMDLIQAKVLAIQLKKNLKHHEGQHSIINLSPSHSEALGISGEDWI